MDKNILVVDDELDVVQLVKNRLLSHNYGVITAFDGEEALYKARMEKPELIVLDVMIPLVDGYKVCAELKRDLQMNAIPIIILTAKVGYADKKIAEQCGADGFVCKYYMSNFLIKEIDRLLGR